LIPWSPLARGLLAGKRASPADRQSSTRAASDTYVTELYDHPGDWRVVEAVRQVASRRAIAPAEIALAWLLSRPAVVAPIVGATKLDHLDAAVRALDVELTAEETQQIEAPYEPHGVKGWF
jgi:aryl-alcohol dehydrogenase-like predicted oxidoreductase